MTGINTDVRINYVHYISNNPNIARIDIVSLHIYDIPIPTTNTLSPYKHKMTI